MAMAEDPLPPAAQRWLADVRGHPEVRAVLLGGSGGRGDLWAGSDLDLYVVGASAEAAWLWRPDLGARFADVHLLPQAELDRLMADPGALAASGAVDETAGGRALHDPYGILARWLAFVEARLGEPETRRERGAVRLRAAREALAAAAREGDPLESALLARDSARLAAWADVAGRGGLVTSARRFADRFLGGCAPEVGRRFARAWGLGGGRPAVDASVAALREAMRFCVDGATGGIGPRWLSDARALPPEDREALLRRHPLPELLEPALTAGHHDGVLMWMRGWYRIQFRALLAGRPPREWPRGALGRFHGLGGGERDQAAALLEAVEAGLGPG
jgi:hypothetical protein